MKPLIIILIFSFLSSSCATLMNEPRTKTTIYTTEPSTVIYNSDTFRTSKNKAKITATRRKQPIEIIAISDSIEKLVTINAQNSAAYFLNIICNYGLGMLVDQNRPERYTYPPRVYINSADTLNTYYKYGQGNYQDEILLHISLPHVNSFLLKPVNEDTKTNTGFFGITLGLDYYHGKNQFIQLSASTVSDFLVPFPAPVDFSGHHEFMRSAYVAITNNHKINRFTTGYGLSFSQNTWDLRYYNRFAPPPPIRDPIKKSSSAFGCLFSSYYQLGEYFNLGLIYRPSFLRPQIPDKFKYEHLISLDLAWKIRLKQ